MEKVNVTPEELQYLHDYTRILVGSYHIIEPRIAVYGKHRIDVFRYPDDSYYADGTLMLINGNSTEFSQGRGRSQLEALEDCLRQIGEAAAEMPNRLWQYPVDVDFDEYD